LKNPYHLVDSLAHGAACKSNFNYYEHFFFKTLMVQTLGKGMISYGNFLLFSFYVHGVTNLLFQKLLVFYRYTIFMHKEPWRSMCMVQWKFSLMSHVF